MNLAARLFISLLDQLDKLGASGSIRLTRITGKSPLPIHPKHLLSQDPYFQELLRQEDILLDVGCGNGMNTLKSARSVAFAVGFDIDLDEIRKGKTISKMQRTENVDFVLSDAETCCPFVEDAFDKILLIDVLEHLNNRAGVLTYLSRLLRKHGKLVLSIPNRDTHWKRMKRDAGLSALAASDHKIEYDQASLTEELSASGWRIMEVGPIVVDTPFAGIMDVVGAFSLSVYEEWQRWKRDRCRETPEETTGWRVLAIQD